MRKYELEWWRGPSVHWHEDLLPGSSRRLHLDECNPHPAPPAAKEKDEKMKRPKYHITTRLNILFFQWFHRPFDIIVIHTRVSKNIQSKRHASIYCSNEETLRGRRSLMLNSEKTGRVFMKPFLYNLKINVSMFSLKRSCVPQWFKALRDIWVNSSSIENCRDLIELLPWSKAAVVPESSLGSDKVHAAPLVELVEVVLLWDLDGQAIRVVASKTAVAALWCLSRPAVYDG